MSLLRLSLVLPLACLANTLVLAQYGAYNYGFDINKRVKRQIGRRSAMVVQDKAGGDVVVRQEIRQLEQDQELWTLYILALSMLQFTDQSSPTSYYGLAGIHGMPHQTWGGVDPAPGSEKNGYCTHSSVLFPTWHRPYMALYEQVLHGLVQMIATFWPDDERQRYEAAARRFRHPYWDWAAPPPPGQSVLPRSIGESPFIDVDGPNGVQRIANPLYSYNFRPLDRTAFTSDPWDTWTRTLRSPSSLGPDAQSNNSFVAMNLDQNRASLAQRLYALFSSYDNYTTFSNNAAGGQADSIESLHDTIHSIVGGLGPGQLIPQPGHMAYIQWSAFDPVFFLHHCMVDRIVAIWQTLHPDAWVTPSVALTSSYTTRRGQILNASTALAPFFSSDNGTFWDSDGVRDHTKFGYTYAELLRGPTMASSMARVRNVKQTVNRMYGSFSPANLFLQELRAHHVDTSRRSHASSVRRQAKRPAKLPRSVMESRIFVGGDHYHEWTANVWVGKQALAGAASISLFLGDVPSNPQEWTRAPNHVGTMGVFAASRSISSSSSHPPSSSTGQEQTDETSHDVPVSGTVPLTAALMKKVTAGELKSLRPEHVQPYLERNLRRVVQGPTGQVADAGGRCVAGLRIRVVSSVVAAPWSEEELPEWGEAKACLEMC